MEMELAAAFSASRSRSHPCKIFTYSKYKRLNSIPLQPLMFFPRFLPHRPSIRSDSNTRPPLYLSAGPGPTSPPDSDTPCPPGLTGKLSRFQDRAQIFFAVLFWMSLFFWASAWDGRNSGRPNKRHRYRR